MDKVENKNEESFVRHCINIPLTSVSPGTKLRFSENFKKLINDLPERDWLWYIQNNEFEVKEVVDGKISIKGLHSLGFRTPWHFNICQCSGGGSWILIDENTDFVFGVEVIGFHPDWVHEDYNPNGTRLGFFQEGIGEPFFVSIAWDNESDSYETDEGLMPTHYMIIPQSPQLNQ